jgi:hypothetical protein
VVRAKARCARGFPLNQVSRRYRRRGTRPAHTPAYRNPSGADGTFAPGFHKVLPRPPHVPDCLLLIPRRIPLKKKVLRLDLTRQGLSHRFGKLTSRWASWRRKGSNGESPRGRPGGGKGRGQDVADRPYRTRPVAAGCSQDPRHCRRDGASLRAGTALERRHVLRHRSERGRTVHGDRCGSQALRGNSSGLRGGRHGGSGLPEPGFPRPSPAELPEEVRAATRRGEKLVMRRRNVKEPPEQEES